VARLSKEHVPSLKEQGSDKHTTLSRHRLRTGRGAGEGITSPEYRAFLDLLVDIVFTSLQGQKN